MSSISSVSSSYTSALYQWQNQKLSTSSSGSSSSGSSSSSSSLSSQLSSSSITDQLSSMVELTKYAMNAMGLDSGSRVTFSQITKYRQQLSDEFNASVAKGLASLGVGNLSGVTFTLAEDGSLTAKSSNATDQANAQAWLDNNKTIGKDLRAALTEAGVSADTAVSMTVTSTGQLTLAGSSAESDNAAAMQTVLNNSKMGTTLYDGLESLSVSSDAKFTIQSNEDGTVTIESSDADTKAAVQAFFDDNPALVKKFNQIQALSGLDDARKALQVSPSELRKRIEVESMAAWWSDSGSSSSTFGSYSSSDGLSLLSGLNLSV